MNRVLQRWMWLLLGTALTACASVPVATDKEAAESEQAAPFAELCAQDGSLVPLCDADQCGLYPCRKVMERLSTPSQVLLARTGGAVLPGTGSSAQRYWGSANGLPRNSNPVFIIPWGPKPPLLPSQSKMLEELEAERRKPHEKHHIFPQEPDLKWFSRKGINIHEFTMPLLVDVHRRIHHPPPPGGAWNEAWRQYKDSHDNAPTEEIYRYAGQLIYEFELVGPIVPYYRQWTQPPPIGG